MYFYAIPVCIFTYISIRHHCHTIWQPSWFCAWTVNPLTFCSSCLLEHSLLSLDVFLYYYLCLYFYAIPVCIFISIYIRHHCNTIWQPCWFCTWTANSPAFLNSCSLCSSATLVCSNTLYLYLSYYAFFVFLYFHFAVYSLFVLHMNFICVLETLIL